jgi:hypothetical protein
VMAERVAERDLVVAYRNRARRRVLHVEQNWRDLRFEVRRSPLPRAGVRLDAQPSRLRDGTAPRPADDRRVWRGTQNGLVPTAGSGDDGAPERCEN